MLPHSVIKNFRPSPKRGLRRVNKKIKKWNTAAVTSDLSNLRVSTSPRTLSAQCPELSKSHHEAMFRKSVVGREATHQYRMISHRQTIRRSPTRSARRSTPSVRHSAIPRSQTPQTVATSQEKKDKSVARYRRIEDQNTKDKVGYTLTKNKK
ncbi:hypothetical protein VTI28DRAFT_7001 [Corynascus sepedonium]